MTEREKARRALLALSSAALALPGYSRASPPPREPGADYRYFAYREADVPAEKTSNPQRRRYDINGHAVRIFAPLGSRWSIDGELLVETMSGASPWFITPGANGQPVQVLSGATISEERTDLLLKLTHHGRALDVGGSVGVSEENDYQAINLGIEAAWEPGEAQWAYRLGLGLSFDELEPTEGASARFPERIAQAQKESATLSGSVSRVLDRRAMLQIGGSLTRHSGHLADPYKLVFVENQAVNDARPRQRSIGVLMARYRRHFAPRTASLHLDYRLTVDDWDIESHTLEFAWHQALGPDWQLVPGLRYYSQSQAEFYAPYFESAPSNGLASSDYRLSPYGALSARLDARRSWGRVQLSFGWEHYRADGSFALGQVTTENPGLLEFDLLSVGFSYRFD